MSIAQYRTSSISMNCTTLPQTETKDRVAHVSSCNHFNDYPLKGFHHPDNWPKSVLKKDDRFLAEWRSVERHLQTTPKDKAKVLVTVVQGYSLPQAHTTTVCISLVLCHTNFLGIQKILLDTWEYC